MAFTAAQAALDVLTHVDTPNLFTYKCCDVYNNVRHFGGRLKTYSSYEHKHTATLRQLKLQQNEPHYLQAFKNVWQRGFHVAPVSGGIAHGGCAVVQHIAGEKEPGNLGGYWGLRKSQSICQYLHNLHLLDRHEGDNEFLHQQRG